MIVNDFQRWAGVSKDIDSTNCAAVVLLSFSPLPPFPLLYPLLSPFSPSPLPHPLVSSSLFYNYCSSLSFLLPPTFMTNYKRLASPLFGVTFTLLLNS